MWPVDWYDREDGYDRVERGYHEVYWFFKELSWITFFEALLLLAAAIIFSSKVDIFLFEFKLIQFEYYPSTEINHKKIYVKYYMGWFFNILEIFSTRNWARNISFPVPSNMTSKFVFRMGYIFFFQLAESSTHFKMKKGISFSSICKISMKMKENRNFIDGVV